MCTRDKNGNLHITKGILSECHIHGNAMESVVEATMKFRSGKLFKADLPKMVI